MDNLITNIVSNAWFAFLVLFVLTLILHFILVYPKNLSKKQWKKVDYIWVSLTAIGLIGATNNVKMFLSKVKIESTSFRIPFQYKYLSHFLPPEGSSVVCREYIRNEYSPDNFDSIVADYNRSCDWSKKLYLVISTIDTNNYNLIDTAKIPPLETTDNKWYKGVILDNINEYNKLVREKEENAIQIIQNSEENLLFFTPLLLVLGLAIRITKITGEIRHEK